MRGPGILCFPYYSTIVVHDDDDHDDDDDGNDVVSYLCLYARIDY